MQAKPPRPVIRGADSLSKGLVLALPFMERGGVISRDISGRRNHVTLAAGAGDAAWSSHLPGTTISMDGGAAEPMAIALTSGMPLFQQSAKSVAMWIFPTDLTVARYFWDETDNADGLPRFLILTAGANLRVDVSSAAGLVATATSTSSPILANRWTHVCVVDSGTGLAAYVNGAQVLSMSYNWSSHSWAATTPVCRPFRNLGNPYLGHCASIMAWTRALAGAEVRRHHAYGFQGFPLYRSRSPHLGVGIL